MRLFRRWLCRSWHFEWFNNAVDRGNLDALVISSKAIDVTVVKQAMQRTSGIWNPQKYCVFCAGECNIEQAVEILLLIVKRGFIGFVCQIDD